MKDYEDIALILALNDISEAGHCVLNDLEHITLLSVEGVSDEEIANRYFSGSINNLRGWRMYACSLKRHVDTSMISVLISNGLSVSEAAEKLGMPENKATRLVEFVEEEDV